MFLFADERTATFGGCDDWWDYWLFVRIRACLMLVPHIVWYWVVQRLAEHIVQRITGVIERVVITAVVWWVIVATSARNDGGRRLACPRARATSL